MGNDTETLTLTDFLLARIVEDEDLARMAADTEGADEWAVFSSDVPDLDGAVGTMAHVVRHDPARVLAECAAKRRIVEMGTPYVLAWLAHPYADHPDYREEWRP